MKKTTRLACAALVVIAGASIVLQGCSNGGGGSGPAQIVQITADGVVIPLWQLVDGVPTVPGTCPPGVGINSRIIFTFNGPVSLSSLPQFGVAIGSINILVGASQQPALGTFTVEDDPALPAGNQRRAVFHPVLPSDPANPCVAGLAPSAVYNVNVPMGGVVVHGKALQNSALGCFVTCGCPDSAQCSSPFFDALTGPPYVVMTTPPTSDPAPSAIDPASIAGNTIQILVSEPLKPSGIDLTNIRIINVATGAQVPGSLVFHQTGTLPGLGLQSRIDYVASSQLPPNATFQILFTAAVMDFGGNPIQTSQSNPAALLFFQTAGSTCPHAFTETFDTTQNLGSVSGALQWIGNGFLQAVYPFDVVGDGSDGAFAPPPGPTPFILDTNELVGGTSRQGQWNFTTVNIPAGAIVRIIGPYLAHIRCQGTVVVDGTINVNAGTGNPAAPGTPPYDRGPETGAQNNGAGLNCEALGGVANAGGGIGGTGSGVTPPPGSPPTFQCTVRANNGEAGFGPTINGMLNPSPVGNALYAGGQGGDSGCFPPLPFGVCMTGDIGGLGGAGGTAGRVGEAGVPRTTTAACTPVPTVVQPIAQASPVAVVMVPPIQVQSAGSGGGGGGDHLDTAGTPPNNDDQGGGGGGGGGGLRISSVGAYSQGATGQLQARGAVGGTGITLGGAGGSGSGGEIWIQSFATVTIAPAAIMDVTGPPRFGPTAGNIGCSPQASGGGGAGLIQIEAGQGPPVPPSFNILPVPTPNAGAVYSNPPFQFGATVTGHAESIFIPLGGAPDFTSVVEVFSLGNAANATLTISYQGAQEAVNSTPQNPIFDPTTIKTMATGGGPITAANIDELDGYAFIKFVVDVSFPSPPATPPTAVLPSVDTITINTIGTCP